MKRVVLILTGLTVAVLPVTLASQTQAAFYEVVLASILSSLLGVLIATYGKEEI